MNLKRYLPIEDYTLQTRLSVDAVRQRMADNIDPKQVTLSPFSRDQRTRPYEGVISGDAFEMNRIIPLPEFFPTSYQGRDYQVCRPNSG